MENRIEVDVSLGVRGRHLLDESQFKRRGKQGLDLPVSVLERQLQGVHGDDEPAAGMRGAEKIFAIGGLQI